MIDADSTRTGIAGASRKARIDLGTDLVLDYQAPANIPYERYLIFYENKLKGELVRIYPALTDKGKWSAFENREQRLLDENFPDDPLINQFFTETLFECYRKLGFDIMQNRCRKMKSMIDSSKFSETSDLKVRFFSRRRNTE